MDVAAVVLVLEAELDAEVVELEVVVVGTHQLPFFQCAIEIPGGAATCSEGFVVCFLKVHLVCWGSMAAAVQPNSLGNSQKISYKTSQNKWPPHPVLHLLYF